MIELFSLEFWIAILFILYFVLVVVLFLFVKRVNRLTLGEPEKNYDDDGARDKENATGSAVGIIKMLEPLVEESRKTAISFDGQIREKKRLIKELNDALDSRIISINLLLSRADALQKHLEARQNQPVLNSSSNDAIDQQHQIIEMFNQNITMGDIAKRLFIPEGEVKLVIDLKKKFVAMEKNGR